MNLRFLLWLILKISFLSLKNISRQPTHDIFYLLTFLLFTKRHFIDAPCVREMFSMDLQLVIQSGCLGYHSTRPALWDCLMNIADAYILDSLNLANVDLAKMRKSRPFELRVSKMMEIRSGWELNLARLTRQWYFMLKRLSQNCREYYYHILRALRVSPADYNALHDSVTITIVGWQPGVLVTVWKLVMVSHWLCDIAWYIFEVHFAQLWTITSLFLDRGYIRPGRIVNSYLRVINALNLAIVGLEINTTRPPSQVIGEESLESELRRLILYASQDDLSLLPIRLSSIVSNITVVPQLYWSFWSRPRVETLVTEESSYKRLINVKEERARVALDALQDMLNIANTPEHLKETIHYAMMQLSTMSITFPQHLIIRDIHVTSPDPIASGGFGDIWKGSCRNSAVCLKVPKLLQGSDHKRILEDLAREAILWSRLQHPNVLPFYGVHSMQSLSDRLCLVSPWAENGKISGYLSNNSEVPRVPLIFEIIEGLKYLHDSKIVHGDLKGENVLISSEGSACLADFGISSIVNINMPVRGSIPTMARVGGTMRWMAPELLDGPSDVRLTVSSDIYSLASLMYEVLTGEIPFHEIKNEVKLMLNIVRRVTPAKPFTFEELELSDEIWEIMRHCWSSDPNERPTIEQVSQSLRQATLPSLTQKRLSARADHIQMLRNGTLQSPAEIRSLVTAESSITLRDEMLLRDLMYPPHSPDML